MVANYRQITGRTEGAQGHLKQKKVKYESGSMWAFKYIWAVIATDINAYETMSPLSKAYALGGAALSMDEEYLERGGLSSRRQI
jgi:hypothetical protein